MTQYRFSPQGEQIEICAANSGRWCKISEKMFIVEFTNGALELVETSDVTKVRERDSVDQQFMTEILPRIAETIRQKMPEKSDR